MAALLLFVVAAAGGAWLAVATDDSSPSDPVMMCWDGSEADSAPDCPPPSGREGLSSVFPSLGPGCREQPSREGKAEVFVCSARGIVIRYSRWDSDIDRIAYFHAANPEAFVASWNPGGVDGGIQWTSHHSRGDDRQPWQWSATYAAHPYSVSVEGVSKADRRRGLLSVRARPESAIGLASTDISSG